VREIVLNNNTLRDTLKLTNVKNVLYIVCVNLLQHLVSVQGNVKKKYSNILNQNKYYDNNFFHLLLLFISHFACNLKVWKVKMTIPFLSLATPMV
jgi:hypothetical protein